MRKTDSVLALTPRHNLPCMSSVSTARFPGDLLPRVLGSQIGATLLLALLNNARNQMGESLLLRADGPGRPLWLKEFSLLLDTLAGKLGLLLAHSEVRCHVIASSGTALAYVAMRMPHNDFAPSASTHVLQTLIQSGYGADMYGHCLARATSLLP
jgi:hypothetical protein